MYRDIVVITSDGDRKSYTVTDTKNVFNGYVVPSSIKFYERDEDNYYTPVKESTEYVIRKADAKPSIYKRRFLAARADRYDYAFTERTTKTVTTDKDVYYNGDRDRFITNSRVSTKTKTEYSLPRLIVW